MESTTLYQLDSKGKTRIWSISVEQNESTSTIVAISGLLDGKRVESREEIKEGKNIGKANETTPYEQAVLEATSKIASKKKEGYVEDINNLQSSDTLGSGIKAPMLAEKYHPTGSQKKSKTLDQLKLRGQLIGLQRKIDGNRCNIHLTQTSATFYTRSGDVMPYDFPLIATSLIKTMVDNNLPDMVLDGELYSSVVSFNALNGALRKKTITPDKKAILDMVKIHLYDVVSDEFYPVRYKKLQVFTSAKVHVEEYITLLATEENIDKIHAQFVAEGYEGTMIRILTSPYEHKRTWNLCKYKGEETDEYEVVGVEKHALHSIVGAFVMKAPEGLVDRDGTPITTFKAGTTGMTQGELAELYTNQSDYIGKMATVRYFDLSEYGIPRFPKLIGFRSDL